MSDFSEAQLQQLIDAYLNQLQQGQADEAVAREKRDKALAEGNTQARADLDRNYNLAKDKLKQERDDIAIKKGVAEANAWFQRASIDLDSKKLQMQNELDQKKLALDTELGRGKLGLDAVTQMTQYANSPDDYYKLLDQAQGYRDRQDVPVFMQAMLDNTALPVAKAPGGTATPRDFGGLVNMLSGGQGLTANPTLNGGSGGTGSASSNASSGGSSSVKDPRLAAVLAAFRAAPPSNVDGYSDQDKTALATASAIYALGGGKLGAQAIEQNPTTANKLFVAAGKKLGYDPSIFLEQYARSRFDQGQAGAA